MCHYAFPKAFAIDSLQYRPAIMFQDNCPVTKMVQGYSASVVLQGMESNEQSIECGRWNLHFSFLKYHGVWIQFMLEDFVNCDCFLDVLYIQETLVVLNGDTFVIEVAVLVGMMFHLYALLLYQLICQSICFGITHLVFVRK